MFSRSKKHNETSIAVNFDEPLTSDSCSKIITELIKYILYQKQQIPFSCDILKLQLTSKPSDKNLHSMKTLLSTLDNLTDQLTSQLHLAGSDVSEILVIIGPTTTSPKFCLRFELPQQILSSRNHLEYQHSYRKPLLSVMRTLIESSEFQEAMTVPLVPTNTFVLVQKRDSNPTSDFFLPKPQYSPFTLSSTCFTITFNHNPDRNGNCTCSNIVKVYQDVKNECVTGETTCVDKNVPYSWYQSKEIDLLTMSGLKFLTDEQKNCWIDNGYIKLTNVFSAKEVEEMSREYDEIFERKRREDLEGLESAWIGSDMKQLSGNRGVTVKSIHNLQMHSAVFTRTIMNPKLLDALEDLLDTPDIVLHHSKAHLKPPEKGAPYLMHQDYPYFPHKNHTMLAIFIHIDDTTPDNGGLAVYPGSHKLGPLEARTLIDDNKEAYHYVDPDRFPLAGAVPISAKQGEIIIFSYLLLHGSYLNLSDRPRRMFLIQIRAADDEPTVDTHNSPCQNLVLRGRNVHRKANMATRFTH